MKTMTLAQVEEDLARWGDVGEDYVPHVAALNTAKVALEALRGVWELQTDLTDTNWRSTAEWKAVEDVLEVTPYGINPQS